VASLEGHLSFRGLAIMPSSRETSAIFRFAVIGAQRRLFISPFDISPVFTSIGTWRFLLFTLLLSGIDAKVLPEIYWNSSNPIFRIDNTEHVFVVRIHDRVDFVCPFYSRESTVDQTDVEVMEIHSVAKWAYDYFALTPDSVVAGVCNNPFQRTYATVVFREYTPKPGGLEFKPGRSYYFISASTGQSGGLQNKHGGLCSSKHMKVKFEIEPLDTDIPTAKSGDGFPAAGGVLTPSKNDDDEDSYDGQYQMVPTSEADVVGSKPDESIVSGSSRTHDNSRELKMQNSSSGRYGPMDVTTPRLYEIHTRPQDEFVGVRRPEFREPYGAKGDGSNAQQRRNAGIVIAYCWRTLVLSLCIHSFVLRCLRTAS